LQNIFSLIESGGDWDRRNRLKVYEAYYLVSLRDFAGVSLIIIIIKRW